MRGDRDRRPDDEELEGVAPWDVDFTNPIASGAQVLFGGGLGGFGGPAPVDEVGGEGGPIDEAGGFGFAQGEPTPLDETGGFGP